MFGNYQYTNRKCLATKQEMFVVYCLTSLHYFQIGYTSAPGYYRIVTYPEFSRKHSSHIVSFNFTFLLMSIPFLFRLNGLLSFSCLHQHCYCHFSSGILVTPNMRNLKARRHKYLCPFTQHRDFSNNILSPFFVILRKIIIKDVLYKQQMSTNIYISMN